jgi:hypothetical protein
LAAGTAGTAGSPLLITTAGRLVCDPPPDSRRAAANADHTNGATTGESPDVPPAPSHPATPAPTPSTRPATAAPRATAITGTDGTAAGDEVGDESLVAESPTEPATRPERDTARWGAFAVEPALPAPAPVEPAPVEPAPVESAVELDPAEPVVSANAIGIDATADPTPNANANAPTRPT